MVDCSYWHPNPVQWVGNKLEAHINDIEFCDDAICITDASRMGNWMNETANPCENFYKYVCGSLLFYVSDCFTFESSKSVDKN